MEHLFLTLALTVPWAGFFVFLFWLFMKRHQAVATWENSPDGMLYREALGSYLLAKARLEHAALVPSPPSIRASYHGVMVGRRIQRRFTQEPRQQVQMRVQMILVGGHHLTSEGTVTVPVAELGDLVPGHLFSVLYDPRDPRRFYIDTLRRQHIVLDGVIHRTRMAEEQLRTAQAFHQPAPPQGQPQTPW
ncbi:hypothetical protein [Chondromyces crocatus]|nr:hypothetical protein [Chondromyces crocatus]